MKYIFFITILALFYIGLFAQPKLEFEGGNTFDWGTVKVSDSPIKAKIKIWNMGSDSLIISEVKPGCGCTTAPLDKYIILPNDYATLDVSLNIGGYSGQINKDIRVFSNSQNSLEYLFLKADVFREISTIDDSYFNFGDIVRSTDYSKVIRIKNNTDKDIKISKVEDKPDYCKLNFESGSVISAHSELALKATINMSSLGPFSFIIKVQTEISENPDLYISGWGNVKE